MITRGRIFIAALGALLALGAVAPTTSAAKGSDAAIFKAGLLTANDLPAGFTSNAPGRSAHRPDTSGFANPLPACKNAFARLKQSARVALQASSDDFVNQTTGAESYGTVRVYKDDSAASTYLGVVSSSEFVGCFRATQLERAKQDTTGGTTETRVVSKPTKLPNLGDQVTGLRVVVTSLRSGAPADVFSIDYYYVRVGRAVVYLVFGNPQKALPERAQVVRTVVTRVVRAQK